MRAGLKSADQNRTGQQRGAANWHDFTGRRPLAIDLLGGLRHSIANLAGPSACALINLYQAGIL
jgi:hypothetical protein